MSDRTAGLAISYTIDSPSEDEGRDALSMPTPESPAQNKPARRTRSSINAGSTQSAKKRGRPSLGDSVLGPKKAGVTKRATSKRAAAAEPSNAQNASDTEGADELDTLPAQRPQARQQVATVKQETAKTDARTKKNSAAGRQRNGQGRKRTAADPLEVPETQEDVIVQSNLARTKSNIAKKPRPVKREEIPETQADPEPLDMETSQIAGDQSEPEERPSLQNRTAAHKQDLAMFGKKRAGSASDTDRIGNDLVSRRKMNEMTKRLESLELKYQNLRDVAVTEGESNFEKLRIQSEERTGAANDLIASLRADLEKQSTLAAECEALRQQVASLTSQNETLSKENKSTQASLRDAQNEVRGLQVKLAATRSNSAQHNDGKNAKGLAGAANSARNGVNGASDASKEARKQSLKEELYSDLTGLIVRDVRRNEEAGEDVYDCIQTGRNGTLHFHLMIPDFSNANSTTTYEDAELQYMPLLDESRDRSLLEILPDYLTDDICFARGQAAKFYSRIVDCLTRKLEVVEED